MRIPYGQWCKGNIWEISVIQPHQTVSSMVWDVSVAGNMSTDVSQSVNSLPKGPPRKRSFSSLCCSCGIYQVNQVQPACVCYRPATLLCSFQLLYGLYMAKQEKLPPSNMYVWQMEVYYCFETAFYIWLLIKEAFKELCNNNCFLLCHNHMMRFIEFRCWMLGPSAFFNFLEMVLFNA